MTLHQSMQDLSEVALRVKAERDELARVLTAVLSHERGIVHLFNSMGEAAPAAFSLDCERARSVLRRVQG